MFENTESGLTTDEGFREEDFRESYEAAPVEQATQKPGKWALRDRLRSRVLWAAIVGCLITVLSAFDAWQYIGITAEGFREIAASVGAVLAAFGVFNDPTNREGF
jgi:uncharacterized membrane protein